MGVLSKDNLSRINLKVLGSTNGRMEEFMKGDGKTAKWRAKESLFGLMGEAMKDSTKMIKRKVLALLPFGMEESTRANGRMASSMDGDSLRKKIYLEKAFGRMDQGLNGYKNRMNQIKTFRQLSDFEYTFIAFKLKIFLIDIF